MDRPPIWHVLGLLAVLAYFFTRVAGSTTTTSRVRLRAATINRPLAALRHLLRLAHEDGVLADVSRVRLEREPEGRIRWLEPDEEALLMDACRASRSPHLAGIVTVALETGMRRGERKDFSDGQPSREPFVEHSHFR